MKEELALFEEVAATSSYFDTRYAGGVEALYAAVWTKENPESDKEKTEKAVSEFMDETYEWHEEHRHEFTPYPGWRLKVKENLEKGEA